MPDSSAMARSLLGLSVGDALGQAFFVERGDPDLLVAERRLPPGPWPWSDDTVLALALVEVLEEHQAVDQDALAQRFAARFLADTERGYGAMAYAILHQLGAGQPWRAVSSAVFGGQGSFGNGSAMRVAPLGAFFYDDLERVQREARASAEVTHFHPEGIAGAEAVALCAAELLRAEGGQLAPAELLLRVAARLSPGETRAGVAKAATLLGVSPAEASRALGDGRLVRCSDTVPFALWCAASSPRDY